MRTSLGWPGALAALMLVTSPLLPGCGEKVDCDRLDKRLHDCTQELMFTLNPEAAARLKKATDPKVREQNQKLVADDIARNRKVLKEKVVDQCKAKKGRAADAKEVNKCLSEGAKDCHKFAACFARYLKTKSK